MLTNKDVWAGKWSQLTGKIKEKWGMLTNDELTQINGKRDMLVGKIQEKYGYTREKAEREIENFEKEFNDGCHKDHNDKCC